MRATSATVLVIFLKVPFQKFLDHNQVNVFSQDLRNNIDNSILKDILLEDFTDMDQDTC